MRKLGLDLGSKTCGIAISNDTNTMALGLYNFRYADNNMMLIINKIKSILDDYMYDIDTFVLGYPKNLVSNNLNESCIRCEKFKKLLETNFKDIKVIYQDENFTTSRATEKLMSVEIKSSQRKKVIDMISAQIILEDYLLSINNK